MSGDLTHGKASIMDVAWLPTITCGISKQCVDQEERKEIIVYRRKKEPHKYLKENFAQNLQCTQFKYTDYRGKIFMECFVEFIV